MKRETKLRNAMITLYWEGHTDGRICGDNGILKHIQGEDWSKRRATVINKALKTIESAYDAGLKGTK